MRDTIFHLGLGTLLTHELDAVANHEWRVLPLLRDLPDAAGMAVFIVLHVPLFAGLIALVGSTHARLRRASRLGVAAFLVVHGILHALFTGHVAYEFSSLVSRVLIFGGALLGAAYLVVERPGMGAPATRP